MEWEVALRRNLRVVIGNLDGEQRLSCELRPGAPVKRERVRSIVRDRLEQIFREGSFRG